MRTLLAAVAAFALSLVVLTGAGTAQALPLSAPGARIDVQEAQPLQVRRRYYHRHYYYRPFRVYRYHYRPYRYRYYRPYRYYGYYHRPYRKHLGFSIHF
jgi:hypothetical protein